MHQFVSIAINGFMELARQPVILLLTAATSILIPFLASMPYFALGQDQRMVKDTVLAMTLLSGLFGAVLAASNTLAREIRSGTALAVLSKPVGRAKFLLARFVGVALILGVQITIATLASLLGSRLAYDAYGEADIRALFIHYACVGLGFLVAGFSNYFLRRTFVSDALAAICVLTLLGFIGLNFFDAEGKPQNFAEKIDWRMASAGMLILFAVWVIAAIALACSTRLEMIPTLAVCTLVFLLGLMSDYFFGGATKETHWWAALIHDVTPNWQRFWMADSLSDGARIPASYMGACAAYAATQIGAALCVGLALFEDRELS